MSRLPFGAVAAVLFVASLAIRVPVLELPLEGSSAFVAALGDRLGREEGWVPTGEPPLMPMLLAVPVAAGVDPTTALRVTDALLGSLLAPLVLLLGAALGLPARAGRWAGVVTAVHPMLTSHAGGASPGTASLTTLLLLLALAALTSRRPGRRRAGALAAVVLPFAGTAGIVYLPALAALYVWREPSRRARVAISVLAALVLFLGPSAPFGTARSEGAGAFGVELGVWMIGWLPLAALVVLGIGIPFGLRMLWTTDGVAGWVGRCWILSAGLHVLLLLTRSLEGVLRFDWQLVGIGLPLVPLVVVSGVAGLDAIGRRVAQWVRPVSVGLAFALSVFLCIGAIHLAPRPRDPAPVGRLTWLRDAGKLAARIVGPGGWVVLGIGENEPAFQASVADGLAGQFVWTRRAPAAARSDLRRLPVFPARAYALPFALILSVEADAGSLEGVTTFEGAGVFHQEIAGRFGPYIVLRVQRPAAE